MSNGYQNLSLGIPLRWMHSITMVLLLIFSLGAQNALAKKVDTVEQAPSTEEVAPPERANQEASFKGFSTWDIQTPYGSSFHEPGVSGVEKGTATLENSSAWSWGSSYFFMDYLKSIIMLLSSIVSGIHLRVLAGLQNMIFLFVLSSKIF